MTNRKWNLEKPLNKITLKVQFLCTSKITLKDTTFLKALFAQYFCYLKQFLYGNVLLWNNSWLKIPVFNVKNQKINPKLGFKTKTLRKIQILNQFYLSKMALHIQDCRFLQDCLLTQESLSVLYWAAFSIFTETYLKRLS